MQMQFPPSMMGNPQQRPGVPQAGMPMPMMPQNGMIFPPQPQQQQSQQQQNQQPQQQQPTPQNVPMQQQPHQFQQQQLPQMMQQPPMAMMPPGMMPPGMMPMMQPGMQNDMMQQMMKMWMAMMQGQGAAPGQMNPQMMMMPQFGTQPQQQQQQQQQTQQPQAPTGKTSQKKGKKAPAEAPWPQLESEVKKPKNLFIYYKDEQIQLLKPQMAGASCTEYVKIIGQKWKGLTEEEKEPYKQMAAADMSRYREEIKAEKQTAKNIGYKTKTPGTAGSKRSKYTSFVVFIGEMRPIYKQQNPNISQIEVTKQAGIDWGNMTEEQKQKYKDLADKMNETTKEAKLESQQQPQSVMSPTQTPCQQQTLPQMIQMPQMMMAPQFGTMNNLGGTKRVVLPNEMMMPQGMQQPQGMPQGMQPAFGATNGL